MQVTHLLRSVLSIPLLVGLVVMGTAQSGNAQGKDIVASNGVIHVIDTVVLPK